MFSARTKAFCNNLGLAGRKMEMFLKALLTTHFLLCWRFLVLAQRHSPSENMQKVKPELLDFISNLCRSVSKLLENTNPCGMFACSDSSFVLSLSPSNICCLVLVIRLVAWRLRRLACSKVSSSLIC